MDTLTSGQVTGLTQVTPQRIYHYVKDFPEFFTEGAKVHHRGRRWTTEDVEIILSIQALYHDRTGRENIRQLIGQGWRMKKEFVFGRESLSNILEVAQIYSDSAHQLKITSDQLTAAVEADLKIFNQEHETLAKLRSQFADLQREFYDLKQEVKTKRYSLFGPKDTGMHR